MSCAENKRYFTPVRCPCNRHVANIVREGRDSKVGEFDDAFLGGEDIGTFDVPMDDTLVVQVNESIEDLGDVCCSKVLWQLSEVLA